MTNIYNTGKQKVMCSVFTYLVSSIYLQWVEGLVPHIVKVSHSASLWPETLIRKDAPCQKKEKAATRHRGRKTFLTLCHVFILWSQLSQRTLTQNFNSQKCKMHIKGKWFLFFFFLSSLRLSIRWSYYLLLQNTLCDCDYTMPAKTWAPCSGEASMSNEAPTVLLVHLPPPCLLLLVFKLLLIYASVSFCLLMVSSLFDLYILWWVKRVADQRGNVIHWANK